MQKVFQLIITGFIVVIFFACDVNRVFEDYRPVPDGKWHKDSLMVFNIPVTDTVQNNNLYVNIRNDVKYSYSNLWLFIEIIQPGGTAVKDTFEMVLADSSGKWLGEGFGGLKTRQAVYRRNVFFPASGDYTVNVQHGMREEVLDGISDVGFRVEKTE
ncbi:MAG: gliding motility lipoprotein GldH [Bacteroidota bacterium]